MFQLACEEWHLPWSVLPEMVYYLNIKNDEINKNSIYETFYLISQVVRQDGQYIFLNDRRNKAAQLCKLLFTLKKIVILYQINSL